MIVRLVWLSIKPEHSADFEAIFEESHSHIAAMEGCMSVELLAENRHAGQFVTLSRWRDEHCLEAYRLSPLFKSVWPRTKALFSAPAKAASYHHLFPV